MSTSNSRLSKPLDFMSNDTPKWRAKIRKMARKRIKQRRKRGSVGADHRWEHISA